MSKLIFDGQLHQLSFVDKAGRTAGTWAAYNNVDSHATINHLANEVYVIQDRTVPHSHTADANGPYGLYGIIRFNVPGHPGIGVHSGRANARHLPGPQHPTMGCIRTTDQAMSAIRGLMKQDPLKTIEVRNNSLGAAHKATTRNQHKTLLAGQQRA